MKLTELDPEWLTLTETAGTINRGDPITMADAQGIIFLCPICFVANNGRIGTHAIICWSRSRGVPDTTEPKPGRWTFEGTSFSDLTLNGDPPGNARSILLIGPGCGWHGFITGGEVT